MDNELIDEVRMFLCKVNKVTAPHRHGQSISKRALSNLANAQIDLEELLEKLTTNKKSFDINDPNLWRSMSKEELDKLLRSDAKVKENK